MTNDPAQEAVRQLARLRQEYRERLSKELLALRALGESLGSPGSHGRTLESLHLRLHKLAGSGGTFGLPGLSAGARALEHKSLAWLHAGDGPVPQAEHQAFLAGLDALAEICASDEADAPAVAPTAAVERPQLGETVRLWLIDDDVELGRELARQFESFNYTVRLFCTLGEAERAAGTERPDMLIMDVMFEQEGVNATEALAQCPALRALNCPVLFVSSFDDFHSRVRAARLGAVGYFLKPLDVPKLVGRMNQVFQQMSAPPQRVLVVDDDEELARHYRLTLQLAGMKVQTLENPGAIMEKIAEFRPELVLLDMHMPEFSGPDLAGVIRQHDNWASLPIVYLSAETDVDLQIAAMHRGADDFLHKPISDLQLVGAVRARVERARQLEAQISRDSLTGLLKHASIKDSASLEVVRARRSGKPVCLVMLDIDHFKAVNDTYGHATGDVVIASVAMLLRQRLRQSDIVGRYGGEEFVAVMPECDATHAMRLIDEIRERFAAVSFNHGSETFTCTISGGVACSSQYPDQDAAQLLVSADEALYQAKRNGRNQVRLAGQ